MRKYFAVVLMLLLVVPATQAHADVGFGIPDMVEEKVEELDEKVRNFDTSPEQLPLIQAFEITAGDTSLSITEAVISRDNRRIYLVVDDRDRPTAGLDLSFVSGSGQSEGENSIAGTISEHLALNSAGEPVVLSRVESGTSTASQLQIFNRDLDGFAAPLVFADTFTTLGFDENDNIYLAGTAGIMKLTQGGDTVWRDSDFRVPEDNMIVSDNNIFISTINDSSGGFTLKLHALDQNDGSVEWSTRLEHFGSTTSGTSYLVPGSNNLHLMFNSPQTHSTNYSNLYVLDKQTGSMAAGPHGFGTTRIPTLVDGTNHIYAGDTDGTIYRIDPATGGSTSIDVIPLSDANVMPRILDDSDSLYVSAQTDDTGAVIATDKNLSGTTPIFVNNAENLPTQTRPVWLTNGFLGIVFNGSRLTVSSTPLDGDDLEGSAWPHIHHDNQQTRSTDIP